MSTSTNFDALAAQALALPEDQRFELAQRLWESVEGLVEEDEELFAEIERRDKEMESGKVKPISYDQAMQEIRDSLK